MKSRNEYYDFKPTFDYHAKSVIEHIKREGLGTGYRGKTSFLKISSDTQVCNTKVVSVRANGRF